MTARPAATGTAPPRIATVPIASPACTNVSSRNPSNPWSSRAAASLNGSPRSPSTIATSRRPSRSAVAIKQKPAPAVYPVFTPVAPGYSHSSALRFCTRLGGPDGAGIVRNFDETMRANPGWAKAARVSASRSRAVDRPRSSRPLG